MQHQRSDLSHDFTDPRMSPLDKALALAALGLHVHPCNPADKSPLLEHGHHDASTDPALIELWWTRNPDALVGVSAGASGLFVVDVDIDPAKGVNGWESLYTAELAPLPDTYHYKTRRGGDHYVYAAPDGVQLDGGSNIRDNGLGEKLPGVDRRGGSSYFIWWPDEVPAIRDVFTDAAPARLAYPATSSVERSTGAKSEQWFERASYAKATPEVKEVLARFLPEGMGHEDMFAAVGDMVRLGTQGHAGAAKALTKARATYLEDYPDYDKKFDDAVRDQVDRKGLPPVTFEITKAERKQLRARAEGKVEGVTTPIAAPGEASHANDLEVASEVTQLLSGSWIYIMASGIYRYDGKVWQSTEKLALEDATSRVLAGIVRREIRRVYNIEGLTDAEKKKAAGPWAAYLNAGKIASVARLVTGQMGERRLALDSHPDLLNAQNGVVDLRTKELLPHDPAYLFTKIAGADYVPGATSKLWRAALKAFESKETRDYMQVRLGQAATGHSPDDHKVCFLHGSGGNGKSTIIDGTVFALGSYSTKVDKSLLLGNANAHPTVFMDLKGARFAYFEEPPGGAQLNMERIKDLAGTKEIKGRYMGEDFQTFPATHSLIGSTNHAFQVADTDDGTWRRLMLVSFPWKFTEPGKKPTRANERKGDPRLKDAFETPDPAVLAWLVDGAHAWYANGKIMPPVPGDIQKSTTAWRGDTDQVLGFFSERLELAEGYAIPISYLYAEFRMFLKSRGRNEWNDETIRDRMFQHVAMPDVTRGKVREGRNWTYSKPPLILLSGRGPNPAAPNWCYLGVRFKTQEDEQHDAVVTPIRAGAKR